MEIDFRTGKTAFVVQSFLILAVIDLTASHVTACVIYFSY